MTRVTINGEKYLKRKEGNPEALTKEEKKMLEQGKIKFSHYATGYFFYRFIK